MALEEVSLLEVTKGGLLERMGEKQTVGGHFNTFSAYKLHIMVPLHIHSLLNTNFIYTLLRLSCCNMAEMIHMAKWAFCVYCTAHCAKVPEE